MELNEILKELRQLRKEASDNPYTSTMRKLMVFERYTEAIEALMDLWMMEAEDED